MLPDDIIGWDLGGAHLKIARMDVEGYVLGVAQVPCPLWQGVDYLRRGIDQAMNALQCESGNHAVTMTGELVDLFASRSEGVRTLIKVMEDRLWPARIHWYAGAQGFLNSGETRNAEHAIASSNWLASASFVARHVPQALFVDIGSTTTDIIPIRDGMVAARGCNDNDRLRFGEMLYTGVVRTPLMAVAGSAPFMGAQVPQMAEHFAVTADVYRLTGELPRHADQLPSADNGPKTLPASARRIARMLGLDLEAGSLHDWQRLARYYREQQLHTVANAVHLVESDRTLKPDAPLVGCGIGRFLARDLAARCGRTYVDMYSLLKTNRLRTGDPADCVPAVAVAGLARSA